MAGVVARGRRRASAPGLALLLLGALPAPTAAADESFTLPGSTYTAVTLDVDEAPGREVVRITTDPLESQLSVDAWSYRDRWTSMGSAPVMRSDAGGVLLAADPFDDAVALLPFTDRGRERLLVVTGGADTPSADGFGAVCCVTIFEVLFDSGGPRLVQRSAPLGSFDQLVALDLDGDGSDELVATEPPSTLGVNAAIIRWTGADLEIFRRVQLPSTFEHGFGLAFGDTDGLPGEEALFGPTQEGSYGRVYLDDDGVPQVESALIGEPEAFGWIAGAVDGRMVVVGEELTVAEWPRGGEVRAVRTAEHGSPPGSVWMIANGREAVILYDSVFFGPIGPDEELPDARVMDMNFETLATIEPAGPMAAMQQLPETVFSIIANLPINLFFYGGPLVGALDDGREAAFVHGKLLTLDAAGRLDIQPAAGLTGTAVGVAGPDGSWLLTTRDGFPMGGRQVYLYPSGGPNASVTLVPMDAVLVAQAEPAVPTPTLRNAVTVTDPDGTQRLLAADGGFEAVIDGPPESQVYVVINQSVVEETVLEDAPLTLPVAPRRPTDENQAFDAIIVVVTPTGQLSVTSWEAEILREPPDLSAAGATKTLALAATVEGETSPNAAVTIGGTPIELDADGGFSAEVSAWPWPQDLRIVARDPVGNEAVRVVSVVGIFDYRGLPWVPIVGILTVAGGAVLYARTPRHRPVEMPALAGDGRLEEIDAD